ncbi:MAG: STAS domain-containing protein [Actinobacteria bacterium]|nr:STAS domain-containing protein [Actinomycetota bacterium]
MTVTTFRYGNPARDCGRAQLRAHCRQLATVVTVTGAVDEANADAIVEYAAHNILAEKPFVLDLSGVSCFSPQGISLLRALSRECGATGVDWRLIAGDEVARVLVAYAAADIPTAESVPDALAEFAEFNRSRRRLLPILTKTA